MASPTHIMFRRLVAALDAGDPSLVMLPETRKEALSRGAKHFFTGKACKRGHISLRWTCDYGCATCNREHLRTSEWREYHREYSKAPRYRSYAREYQQRRDAGKSDATPCWLTAEHLDQMRAINAEAARLTDETGIPHHVDHIVPLRHPAVCGLHVPSNLQILTAEENQSKNNSFDGTMDNEGWRRT